MLKFGIMNTHTVLHAVTRKPTVCRVLFTWWRSSLSTMSSHGETDVSSKNGIWNIRKPYYPPHEAFTEDKLHSGDPIKQFESWFEIAASNDEIQEPNAMTLATADSKGRPSARMVLLKGFGQDGFRFFSNYSSRKARDLACNPFAALVLYWGAINRSVRIEGIVEKLSDEESIKYFQTRPRRSQIAAHVSQCQSSLVDCRDTLEKLEQSISEKYKGCDVPRPDFWGGYILKPHTMEFWQGQSNRMHDRIHFSKMKSNEPIDEKSSMQKGENGWVYQRLFP